MGLESSSVTPQVATATTSTAATDLLESQTLEEAHRGHHAERTGTVAEQERSDAYVYEYIRMQVAAVFRNAQLMGKEVADYAQFMNPSSVPFGQAIKLGSAAERLINRENSSVEARFVLDLDAYEILLGSQAGATSAAPGSPVIAINNRLTGNSMTLDGATLNSIVDGKVTASTNLAELFAIKPGQTSGSIMLENGSKLTFLFDTSDMAADDASSKAKLTQVFLTHPDGSHALVSGLKDPANMNVEVGQETDANLPQLDALIQDGPTLFMDPTGAALHLMNPQTSEFQGIFGDDRALATKLNRFSFGGNIYNFFISPNDGEWKAQQIMGQNTTPGSGAPGTRRKGRSSWNEVIDRIQRVIGLPGFIPPSGVKLKRAGSIEDLLLDEAGGGDQKMALARQQLQNPNINFETKLFILLYVFLDKNGSDLDKLFKQLGGVDSNGNKTGTGTQPTTTTMYRSTTTMYPGYPLPPGLGGLPTATTPATVVGTTGTTGATTAATTIPVMTPQTASWPLSTDMQRWMQAQPISDQLKFISSLQPRFSSTDPQVRNREMQQFAIWSNGQQQGLQLDQSLLQVRLTSLVRDRQQFSETVANAMKAMDDAQHNTIRRIV